MVKSKALGRGLEALIPTFGGEEKTTAEAAVSRVPVHTIRTNPYQPRSEFSEEELRELAQSIKEKGLISPVTLTEINGENVLIAGERRLRACKMLGMENIPAYFRDIEGEEELMELALIENVQRENLNPIEEAIAYRALIERYGLSQETVADRIGKKRSTVTNSLRLLKLPPEIRESLISEEISSGHARAILAAPNEPAMLRVWQQVVQKGLSVRETEQLTRKNTEKKPLSPEKTPRDPSLLKIESAFQQALGTKVRLRPRGKGGSVEIEYYNADDMERILEIIETGSREVK
ncbi:MAG: ParB/RepB/Spo0J family partition protein [Candidatus Neomarinimicrobiota bacterium]|jgi:ParB family chromosome partitioning protein|nr:ParB/RepB/Spo0J family partition protein [Candidatus Neomarinimicrobiota bacterium]MDD3966491.1 ParB/RepB/Spo0J family partition protein [Candidatus Neomarinimicrobiota bacterium]MDX9780792.1 ParB/RepB/Spo0J family partition protein [bacterium]